jgi:hypothetical protein
MKKTRNPIFETIQAQHLRPITAQIRLYNDSGFSDIAPPRAHRNHV